MRIHRTYAAFQPWRDRARLTALVRPEFLRVVRIEPVLRAQTPSAIADLHFVDGTQRVTVPFVIVDVPMLQFRERDPLVFPAHVAESVTDVIGAQLIERIAPLLERRALQGGRWKEEAIRLDGDPVFDAARAAGWFAAAPLAIAVPRIAPALYAWRLGEGKRVLSFGPGAVERATFLEAVATVIAVDREEPEAAHWFGQSFDIAGEADVFDLAIGSGPPPPGLRTTVVEIDASAADPEAIAVVGPSPTDGLLSFDEADGPRVASFAVRNALEPQLRPVALRTAAPAAGGSSGRIALVARPDAHVIRDADSDEIEAYAEILVREGFTPVGVGRIDDLELLGADLIHVFGTADGARVRAAVAHGRKSAIPVAVHVYDDEAANGGYWGAAVTPYCFAYSADERSVDEYLKLLAQRLVTVDDATAAGAWSPAGAAVEDARWAIEHADLVYVHSESTRRRVETIRRGPTVLVAPVVPAELDRAPIGAIAGTDRFILIHAPIGPVANQLLAVRAAETARIPLVIAGPVADPAYAALLGEFATPRVRFVPNPSPGMVSALYRAAAAFADVGWIASSAGRVATAAACEAAIVASERFGWERFGANSRLATDPADVLSVGRAFAAALDASASGAAELAAHAAEMREMLQTSARSIIRGYALIAVAP